MVSQWSFHGGMKEIIYSLFLRISAIGVADRQTVRRPSIIRPSSGSLLVCLRQESAEG
jgi:hypothetical protein